MDIYIHGKPENSRLGAACITLPLGGDDV